MMAMLRVALLLALLPWAGCYRYAVSSGAPSEGLSRERRGPLYLWGLVGRAHEVSECELGVARAESFMPWWGGIVAVLTVGAVLPWRVEYECVEYGPDSAAPSGSRSR